MRISGVSEIFTETDDALPSNNINCLLKLRNSIDYIRECKCRSYSTLKFISANGKQDLQSLRESVQNSFSTINREVLFNETLKKVLLGVKSSNGHLYTKKKEKFKSAKNALFTLREYIERNGENGSGIR